jgi:hypothetical protein
MKRQQTLLAVGFALLMVVPAEAEPIYKGKAQTHTDGLRQRRVDANERQYLDSAFAKIKRNGDIVRVLVRVGSRLNFLPGYRDMHVGSQFEQRDRHFNIKYHVKRIQKDGIVIGYQGRAWRDGQVTGEVKLKWKS